MPEMETETPEAAISHAEPASAEESGAPKRKASPSPDVEDASSKRPRRDSALSNRENEISYDDPERRKSVTKEEKKRGMRLFGGLLNTLSQTTASTQQKRRQEVEKRQQERAHKQRAEDDKRRQDKLARITEIRRQEQIFFDEKVVRVWRISVPFPDCC